ncbi:hypothetical protein NXV76_09260 [Parabacteroides distasonis]|uniref:HU family DNA-binding protein n=1 Tax=Parabacteroides distasonis TaxID=823 RepID=UPI002165D9F9|nr:HU family DNA-binding protein [Parabacteroides distasonis]MCS2856146.1 hypothetical protein [Parabacteroides distasonis]
MALQYKIMMREVSDLKGGAKVEKAFAVPVYTGYTELEDICKAISERSALSSADVKGVLDSLNYVLDLELRGGRIVRMGELGNFRMSFSSKAADPAAKFNATGNITGGSHPVLSRQGPSRLEGERQFRPRKGYHECRYRGERRRLG